MPRIVAKLSTVSASLALGTLGALAACSGPAELPAESLDLAAAPTADLGQPSVTAGCRPGAVLHLPLPLGELRSTTPLPVEVMVTDSAGATAAHPVKVTLEKPDGTLIATLVDAAAPLGALPVSFTPAAHKDLPSCARTVPGPSPRKDPIRHRPDELRQRVRVPRRESDAKLRAHRLGGR